MSLTGHFYTCSDKILCGLGRMYVGGGELTENIDDVGGAGTAEFASKAIDIFYMKLVDCLEKCLIYGHIRRFAD